MDPFSITVGTIGLIDACVKLTKFLKQAKDGFQKIDEELEELAKELTAVHSVSALIKSIYESDPAGKRIANSRKPIDDQWRATRTILEGCRTVVEKLNRLIVNVTGDDDAKHPKIKNLKKFLKQHSKEDEFITYRQRLRAHLIALQTNLAAVNM